MKLTKNDYITILKYYNINVPKDTKLKIIRQKAEQLIAEKLCRCIKKVDTSNLATEARAIAICKNSILTKKNIGIHHFTCKKKPKLYSKKGSKSKTKIIKRN